jgi:hypothetical protein
MEPDCRPNFFILGAAKCGTTSLHHYLDQHPHISMSRVKEPCVFSNPRWWPRSDNYRGLFDCRAPRRGESSTSYTRYPAEGDAAPRIHEAVPDAKLIYLVRDPVERLIADYVHHAANGLERRPINEALRDFRDPENFYVCTSRYAMQVRRYLDYFDASALLVIEQSELRDQRDEILQKVFAFLGVDPAFRSAEFGIELMTWNDFVRYEGFARRLRASVLGRAYRRMPLRQRLPVARVARRLFRAVPQPQLDPALHAALTEFLSPELEHVRSITGKPLEGFLPHANP